MIKNKNNFSFNNSCFLLVFLIIYLTACHSIIEQSDIESSKSIQSKSKLKEPDINLLYYSDKLRLHDIWVVKAIFQYPVSEFNHFQNKTDLEKVDKIQETQTQETPRLEIYPREHRVLGFDGKNSFIAKIQLNLNNQDNKMIFFDIDLMNSDLAKNVGDNKIDIHKKSRYDFRNIIKDDFYQALLQVRLYRFEGLNLILMNDKGDEVLRLLKVD